MSQIITQIEALDFNLPEKSFPRSFEITQGRSKIKSTLENHD